MDNWLSCSVIISQYYKNGPTRVRAISFILPYALLTISFLFDICADDAGMIQEKSQEAKGYQQGLSVLETESRKLP